MDTFSQSSKSTKFVLPGCAVGLEAGRGTLAESGAFDSDRVF